MITEDDHERKAIPTLNKPVEIFCWAVPLYCTLPYISLLKWKGQAGKSPTTSLGFNIHRDIRTERSWWKCVRDRFALVTMALYYREMDRVQDDWCHGSWGKYFVGIVNHFAPAIFTVFQLWWGMQYGTVRSHWFGLVSNGTGDSVTDCKKIRFDKLDRNDAGGDRRLKRSAYWY